MSDSLQSERARISATEYQKIKETMMDFQTYVIPNMSREDLNEFLFHIYHLVRYYKSKELKELNANNT